MLPASDLSAILSNLAALQLDSETTTAVIGAVLAPLLRSSERVTNETARGRRPRSKRRVVPRQKRKYNRAEPRERAIAGIEGPAKCDE